MANNPNKVKTTECPMCQGSGQVPDSKAGQALRDEREALGLNRREVAGVLGYSNEYIRDLEVGHRRVSLEFVEKYRAALVKLAPKEE